MSEKEVLTCVLNTPFSLNRRGKEVGRDWWWLLTLREEDIKQLRNGFKTGAAKDSNNVHILPTDRMSFNNKWQIKNIIT